MNHRPLISTEELAQHLLDRAQLVIVDCRFSLADTGAGRRAYAESHIPGAHYVHLDEDMSGAKTGSNGRHPLPAPATFVAVMRKVGATPSSTVVAYDDAGGIFAARWWWLMRWLGFFNCAVLDGGWGKWQREGRPVSDLAAAVHASAVDGVANTAMQTDADEVLKMLDAPGSMQLIDARSPERFRGENETLDLVGGHIPGAANHFFQLNLESDGCFKSAAELYRTFRALIGERNPQDVVHQCGSGVTACHNLLAMEIAGLYGSRLYPGSWSEWCADARRPVAR